MSRNLSAEIILTELKEGAGFTSAHFAYKTNPYPGKQGLYSLKLIDIPDKY